MSLRVRPSPSVWVSIVSLSTPNFNCEESERKDRLLGVPAVPVIKLPVPFIFPSTVNLSVIELYAKPEPAPIPTFPVSTVLDLESAAEASSCVQGPAVTSKEFK